jgi:hypothetical integral membrane protein (TIGR02206 family)
MDEPPIVPLAFHAYDAAHVVVLGLTASIAAASIALTRRGWHRGVRSFEIMLAVLLLSDWPLSVFVEWRYGSLNAGNAFPFHLCDVAAIIGALALITHNAELCELLWFWGLAGTMQGLITPALELDWPHPRFVVFFLLHCGVVVAALHLVIGRGHTPRRGAVWRATALLLGYAVFAGSANAIIGLLGGEANYGFMCAKPPTASLFDYLGPWPWYIGSVLVLAGALFSLLDLPFRIRRRRKR